MKYPVHTLLMTLFLQLFPDNAHAYIDPGTGSIVIQVLIAGFLGAVFILRTFWSKITGLFSSKTKQGFSDSDEDKIQADD
jgi:hypothetical protein